MGNGSIVKRLGTNYRKPYHLNGLTNISRPRGKRISQLDTYVDVVSRSRCILVVEKDAVFQRLAEDRIFAHYPCILVTARGNKRTVITFLTI